MSMSSLPPSPNPQPSGSGAPRVMVPGRTDSVERFQQQRIARWRQLEQLLIQGHGQQSGRRAGRLDAAHLEALGRLYRLAVSDLAIARRDFPRDRTTRYLDELVTRAHPAVYRPEGNTLRDVGRFAVYGFPRLFRETWRFTLAAFLLFAVPFLLVFALTLIDPAAARMVLPGSPVVEGIEQGQSWLEIERRERPLMASFIATNNIQVTFLAFAGGVAFGLGTVWVMINNGLQIGAIAALASVNGLGSDLLAFVSPHGGIELSVIFIAGGAGLRLGWALLRPGLLPRMQALAAAGQVAIRLMAGCVPLLLIAGTIEGFLSPSGLPEYVRMLIGLGILVLFYAWLLLVGREPAQGAAPATVHANSAPTVQRPRPRLRLRNGRGQTA